MTAPGPFLLIAMAAHNAEASIQRAIRSVLPQLSAEVNLVIVDDGSTDRTGEIIVETLAASPFAKKITHPHRRGYAAALATGFTSMTSEYIMCVDADDILLADALPHMLKLAHTHPYDMVIAPMVEVRGGRRRTLYPRPIIHSLNDMPVDTVHFSLCNKLLRRHHDASAIPIPDIDRWADLGITSRILANGPHIVQSPYPIYEYHISPTSGSLSRSAKDVLLRDHLAMARTLDEWMSERGFSEQNAEFLRHLKFCAKVKHARLPHRNLTEWYRTFPEVNPHIMSLRHIPLRYRLMFTAASVLMQVGTGSKIFAK